LPEVEDGRAVGILVVVGEGEAFEPRAVGAIRLEHGPHAGTLVAAVGEPYSWRNADRI
jgi:hypothetical protein